MDLTFTSNKRRPACNTGLAKVAVQCSVDTFVVNKTLILRINMPPLPSPKPLEASLNNGTLTMIKWK